MSYAEVTNVYFMFLPVTYSTVYCMPYEYSFRFNTSIGAGVGESTGGEPLDSRGKRELELLVALERPPGPLPEGKLKMKFASCGRSKFEVLAFQEHGLG
jgi:hypothetical protein